MPPKPMFSVPATSYRTGIPVMPDELYIYLFSKLHYVDRANVRQVCKDWCRLASDKSLWYEVDVGQQPGNQKTFAKYRTVTDAWLTSLMAVPYVSDLRILKIPRCRKVTDNGLRAVASRGTLTHLNISECNSLSDKVLTAVAASCPNLQVLEMAYCRKMTDSGVATLAAGCRRLHRIDASSCPRLTDASVRAVVTHCPLIEDVRMGWCSYITNAALVALAGATMLTSVSVSDCNVVSDAGVIALAGTTAPLVSIMLENCDRLTDASLAALRNKKTLRHVNVRGCSQITARALRELREARPDLVVVSGPGASLVSNSPAPIEVVGVAKCAAKAADIWMDDAACVGTMDWATGEFVWPTMWVK